MKYDNGYIEWKQWDEADFGRYTDQEAAYFSAEVDCAMSTDRRMPLHILEIGFGNGQFMGWARDAGHSTVGVELNAWLVEVASRSGFLVYQTLTCLKDHDVFDLIVAFDVLEHMTLEGLSETLHSIARLLHPSGVVIARFPNGDSPFGRAFQHGDASHVTTIGSRLMAQLCSDAGLALVRAGRRAVVTKGRGILGWSMDIARTLTKNSLERLVQHVYFGGQRFCLDANLVVILAKATSVSPPSQLASARADNRNA